MGRFRQKRAIWRVPLAFAGLSAIWGSSYLFIRIGLRQLDPLSLVSFRLLIGAAGVIVLAALSRQDLRVTRRRLLFLAILANLNIVVPFLLITWAETRIPSGLAAVFNSTTPIFSVLIAAAVLHDERLTVSRAAGVGIGFVGVVVLVSRDLAGGMHLSGLTGQIAVVLAALLYAIGAVFARYTLRGVAPMAIAGYTVTIAAIETTGLLVVTGFRYPTHPVFATVFSLLWLGLLGSALAYVLYYIIMESWGAARTTLVTYMLPAIGLTLGAVFLAETVDWRIVLGSALVVAGVVLASLTRRPGTPAETEPGSGRIATLRRSAGLSPRDGGGAPS